MGLNSKVGKIRTTSHQTKFKVTDWIHELLFRFTTHTISFQSDQCSQRWQRTRGTTVRGILHKSSHKRPRPCPYSIDFFLCDAALDNVIMWSIAMKKRMFLIRRIDDLRTVWFEMGGRENWEVRIEVESSRLYTPVSGGGTGQSQRRWKE